MRAIVVDTPSEELDALQLRDVPEPKAGADEILIKVAYCGCNWADTQVRSGKYPHQIDFPVIPGMEVSGTIAARGSDISNLSVGDRVSTLVGSGGYAETCAASASVVTRLPHGVPLDVAAAYPVQALTAYYMLHTVYQLKAGQTILVHAAGGGVGLFVTQLAVRLGARVIGTVGTPGKENLPLRYGADTVINLNQTNFVDAVLDLTAGRGVDLAIDSLGATTLDKTFDAVGILGHVINIGEAEGKPLGNIRDRVILRSQAFTRFSIHHMMGIPALWAQGNDYVLQGVADGWLNVPIVERFPLERARDMHAKIQGRGVAGKLLLEVAGGS